MERAKEIALASSEGNTCNGAFSESGDGRQHQTHFVRTAVIGTRAKEKEVARVREEMKARSRDKSDRKSSEFSHGAG